MEKFNFQAIGKDGEAYEGVRESADKFSLYNELRTEGSTLVTAASVHEKRHWIDSVTALFGGVPESEKIIFTKNLGYMIDAGLPVAKSLSVLERQARNARFKKVISALEAEIRKGETLSDAAAQYPEVFSHVFISMVRAGEESGKLAESLAITGEQMDGTHKLKKKIIGAMIYPSIIIALMAAIGVLMLVYVVPSITTTFQSLHETLPFYTQLLIGASSFLKNNILLVLGAVVAVAAGIYGMAMSKKGKRVIDFVSLRLPVVGDLVKETNSARVARTLSSLLSSGVAFDKAIIITSDVVGNGYFRDILAEAGTRVEKGETISSVFLEHTKIVPDFVGEMMSVGEETGRLPAMLMETATYYENSVDQKTKDMSTIIEPVLMIAIGVAVGFFALAIIKPIYSVMDNIS
ncbi:MAG: type II secretion system F family protein [Patescibacteria group bacterium]|nr:type II secretion system F family protein [Patescibacteria group bacterium]MDE1945782.1 type II secretion system F family protein [Patescibacteria group bacterium]